jgi:hypothetical protein
MNDKTKHIIEEEIKRNDGILQLKPCWVSRSFLPPGKRLGLTDAEYDVGERGSICERWIVSETQADNGIFTPHEGQSHLKLKDSQEEILLIDALDYLQERAFGDQYYRDHKGLNRLLKIYDYETRLFYHIHQRQKDVDALGKTSKEEAYHYLDVDLGRHPETFFGVVPSIVEDKRQEEVFVPYLEKWEGDDILNHSFAYRNVPGEGFHLPSGILHAPGTALTLELQESSDVMAVLQADIEGIPQDRNLLTKDVVPELVEQLGPEKAVLNQIDWEACSDPYFYENHHLGPRMIAEELPVGVKEEWVWYNTTKFNGTRITIEPNCEYTTRALGLYGLFIWRGVGMVDGLPAEGQKVSLTDSNDEFLVTHGKALKGVTIKNTGSAPLVAFKFFGPDINNDIVPFIEKR